MAEKSYFWGCEEVGDGGPNSFSQEAVMNMLGLFNNTYKAERSGVIPWMETNVTILESLGLGSVAPTGELQPTYSSGILTIDSGLGIAGGIFYINSVPKTFSIAAEKSGFANAIDRIALRRDILSQTARLVYVKASGAGQVATLVRNNISWDIPIVRVVLDGSGNYASYIDDRQYANSPFSGKVLLYNTEVAQTPTNQTYQYDIAGTKYSSLELEITLSPQIANVFIDVSFSPNPPNVSYVGSPIVPGTVWRWQFNSGLPRTLRIKFPDYNKYTELVTVQGARNGLSFGPGTGMNALNYYSTTSAQIAAELLVVHLDPTSGGNNYVPGGRVRVYGIK